MKATSPSNSEVRWAHPLIEELAGDWRRLDERIGALTRDRGDCARRSALSAYDERARRATSLADQDKRRWPTYRAGPSESSHFMVSYGQAAAFSLVRSINV